MSNVMYEYIDYHQTKREVKRILSRYQKLLMFNPVRHMTPVTQSYSSIPSSTNKSLHGVELAAYKNIKQEQMLKEKEVLIERVDKAVDQLDEIERQIVIDNMMRADNKPDVIIYTDLYMGRTNYYKVKKEATLNLAVALGVEVYKD